MMLPRSIEDLLGVLAEPEIMRLLLAYPGMDLQVPESINAGHPLARAIGIEAAARLVRHAGGGRIYIPASRARAERDRSIFDAHLAGDSVDEIARRHGLTARHVKRILARGQDANGNNSQTGALGRE